VHSIRSALLAQSSACSCSIDGRLCLARNAHGRSRHTGRAHLWMRRPAFMSFLYASPTMRDWDVAASQLQRRSTPAHAHTMTMKTRMRSAEGAGGRVLAKLSPGVAGTRGEKDVASSRTRNTCPAGVRCRTVRAPFPALTIFNCPGFRLQLAIVAADWVRETLISSQPSAIAAGRALPFGKRRGRSHRHRRPRTGRPSALG
jgi:hypothetical protein